MSQVVAPHIRPVLERAIELFEKKFERSPAFAAFAPGRVNLIGEHTDYNGGFALPMAIERTCVVVAGTSHDPSRSTIVADALNESFVMDMTQPLSRLMVKAGAWSSHIAGVAAEFQGVKAELKNIDAVITTDVPLGGGLASSASLEVSFAMLLSMMSGHRMIPATMAKMCQQASHEYVGVPCGIMDQMASAAAHPGRALLIDCEDNSYRSIPLPAADEAVIVIADTGVKHSHAGGEYAKRAAACAEAARILGVPSLRHVSMEGIDAAIQKVLRVQEELAWMIQHVVPENQRVHDFVAACGEGNLVRAGRLMQISHVSLRDRYRVSCPELDQLVEIALKTKGVLGARMTGGGFGGCIVALVESEHAHGLIDTLKRQYTTPTGSPPAAFATQAAAGAGSIDLA